VQVNHPPAPSLSRRGIARSIFMHRGEPKDHEIFARNGSEGLRMRAAAILHLVDLC
jgi:hypothetical protein